MSNAAIIAIAIAAAVVLGALAFVTTARRSDVRGAGALSSETVKRDRSRRRRPDVESTTTRAGDAVPSRQEVEQAGREARKPPLPAPAPAATPAPWVPPDPELIGVSRRQFFNKATITLTSTGIGAFAAAGFVAFLWPTATGGFGQDVSVGKLQDIIDGARSNSGFFYAPSARAWITEYPADALPKAEAVYPPEIYSGMANYGIVALYQKCPHLGCRVPECATSGWFECPCHGSQYNRVGEKKAGPAPRGMDHFPISVDGGGNVIIATGTVVDGAVIGTNTTGQEAEGPHCITGGEGGH